MEGEKEEGRRSKMREGGKGEGGKTVWEVRGEGGRRGKVRAVR